MWLLISPCCHHFFQIPFCFGLLRRSNLFLRVCWSLYFSPFSTVIEEISLQRYHTAGVHVEFYEKFLLSKKGLKKFPWGVLWSTYSTRLITISFILENKGFLSFSGLCCFSNQRNNEREGVAQKNLNPCCCFLLFRAFL